MGYGLEKYILTLLAYTSSDAMAGIEHSILDSELNMY